MREDKTQLIALEVIRVLKTKFGNFPENNQENRNAPFHEAFLNTFKEKIEMKMFRILFPYQAGFRD